MIPYDIRCIIHCIIIIIIISIMYACVCERARCKSSSSFEWLFSVFSCCLPFPVLEFPHSRILHYYHAYINAHDENVNSNNNLLFAVSLLHFLLPRIYMNIYIEYTNMSMNSHTQTNITAKAAEKVFVWSWTRRNEAQSCNHYSYSYCYYHYHYYLQE